MPQDDNPQAGQEELDELLARRNKLLGKIEKIESDLSKLSSGSDNDNEAGNRKSPSNVREEISKARDASQDEQASPAGYVDQPKAVPLASTDAGKKKTLQPLKLKEAKSADETPLVAEVEEEPEEDEYDSPMHNGRLPQSHRVGHVDDVELAKEFDVVIIGGGPAGVAACMKASFLGQRAIVVDKPKLPPLAAGLDVSFGGPTGLWSKALRDTAKTLDVKVLRSMKISDRTIWAQIVESSLKLARNNAENQVATLLAAKQFYLQATAFLTGTDRVCCTRLDGSVVELKTKNILVATGSYPLRMPNIPVDDRRIFDSDSVNKLSYLPKSVLIIGSGIIAFEYAMIFRKLGAKVTLLARDVVVSGCIRLGIDEDIARCLVDAMKNAGVKIFEGCTVSHWEVPPGDREDGAAWKPVVATLAWTKTPGPDSVQADLCLAAIGRVPSVKGFGLEELNVQFHKRGHIVVDDFFCTSAPGIYACGDAIGPPSLASTGVHQAQTAIEMMMQEHLEVTPMPPFPVGMWTLPEASYFGLTKKKAMEQGIDAEDGMAPYDMALRGRVFAAEGMLKLVFRKADGVIIGVHVIGADACEIIHYGMDLVNRSVPIFEVMSTLYIAVTYHELYKAAATQGNTKLDFSLAFRSLAQELGASIFDLKDPDSIDIGLIGRSFEEVDTDNSGELDADEIMNVFHKMGKYPQKSTILNLIRVSDVDKSGTIDWSEFKRLFVLLRAIAEKKPTAPRMRSKLLASSANLPVAVAAFAAAPSPVSDEPRTALKTIPEALDRVVQEQAAGA